MSRQGRSAAREAEPQTPKTPTPAGLPPDSRRTPAALPAGVRRVAIEAGSTGLWRGVVGLDGICIGIDRFGASAPGNRVASEFGISAERVVDAVLAS